MFYQLCQKVEAMRRASKALFRGRSPQSAVGLEFGEVFLISHDSCAAHGSLQSTAVVPIRMDASVRACGFAVPWDRSSPAHGAVVPLAQANRGCYALSQALQQFSMHCGTVFQLCTAGMGVHSNWFICCQINVQSWLLDSGFSQGAA